MSHKFIDSGYEVVDGARICQQCGYEPSHKFHKPAEPSPEVDPMQDCEHCGCVIHAPTNDYPWWHDDNRFLASRCLESPDGYHSPRPAVAPRETQTLRDLAVEIVDDIHGYTMEFAPSPRQHADKYDRVEEKLRVRLGGPLDAAI